MLCAIWYHLHNVKNVNNTLGRVILLVNWKLKHATLLQITLLDGCLSSVLNYENGTKSHKASHIIVLIKSMMVLILTGFSPKISFISCFQ